MSNSLKCESCGTLFNKIKGRGFNNRITCYSCTNGDQKLSWRNKHLKRTYGITLFEMREMFKLQNGKCKICNVDMEFNPKNTNAKEKRNGNDVCVDHCHTTMKVRGLLCFHCNTALGHLFDDTGRMKEMINYVESNNRLG